MVFDATLLIYLAKAERLDVIETLDEPRLVPKAVHHDDARRNHFSISFSLRNRRHFSLTSDE